MHSTQRKAHSPIVILNQPPRCLLTTCANSSAKNTQTALLAGFVVEQTQHQYQVICLWQELPDLFLEDPALLPLAPLASAPNAEGLLQRVVQCVDALEPEQRTEVSGYIQILAGLKFKKEMIQRQGILPIIHPLCWLKDLFPKIYT